MASVSARVCQENLAESKKRGTKGEGRGGEGRGEKELPFVHFVLCSKQGNKIEGFFLNRVCMLGRILGHSGPKQGQGLKPGPAAQSYPNIGLVPRPRPTVFGFCLEGPSCGSFEDAMPRGFGQLL